MYEGQLYSVLQIIYIQISHYIGYLVCMEVGFKPKYNNIKSTFLYMHIIQIKKKKKIVQINCAVTVQWTLCTYSIYLYIMTILANLRQNRLSKNIFLAGVIQKGGGGAGG